MLWNRDIWSRDTVVIQVDTNDQKRKLNMDYVMGEVY
jgi:hypothetical protein